MARASDQQLALSERTSGKLVNGDQWPAITAVLHKHLDDLPERLDALLIDLANLPPVYEMAA
jgi:hypothetical protein